jgi:N-acetyl sugar amidotransferase
MDTSDPEIAFDEQGVCNHCSNFEKNIRPQWRCNPEGAVLLAAKVDRIKREQAGKDYDCILGLSGGVDSSYLAIWAVEQGLRPLVVHVDAGWNSELAVQNIEKLVTKLGLDLHTLVIDWEEMRDLQVAFLRSGVPNQDIPQDHAFFAALYRFAIQHRIRWVLSGENIATESIMPTAWGFNAMDSRHLRAIHRQFGTCRLKTFPTVSLRHLYFTFPFIHRMRVLRPLNYLPFDKQAVKGILQRDFEWKDYGAKHYESAWTKFFQGFYLPARFGFDKRKAHLSSLIISGQITRSDAIEILNTPAYPPEAIRRDRTYILKKLGLSETEFERLFSAPLRRHDEYPNNAKLLGFIRRTVRRLGLGARAKTIFKA